jgi:hypothetical protein
MMEQPDPNYDVTHDPTYERGYGPDRAGQDPHDTGHERANRGPGETETIRPAEEREQEPGSTYGIAGDQELGWRGARDREHFG